MFLLCRLYVGCDGRRAESDESLDRLHRTLLDVARQLITGADCDCEQSRHRDAMEVMDS